MDAGSQDFQLRLDALSTWIARKSEKFGKTPEVPEDCIRDYAAKIAASLEEAHQQTGAVEALQVDVETSSAACLPSKDALAAEVKNLLEESGKLTSLLD